MRAISLPTVVLSVLVVAAAACSGNEESSSTSTGGETGGAAPLTGGGPGAGGTGLVGAGGTTGATGGSAGTGGVTGSGGSAPTGGSLPTGGLPGSGGASSGGASTGGTQSGGVATGGVATGGQGLGGAPTGGTGPSGGMPTGGVDTGGTPTAGSTSAGASAGGAGPSDGGSGPESTGGTFVADKTPGTAQPGDITVDPATEHQTMDGFGIADVWQGKNTSSAEQRTLFWDPDQGIGMSILRIGIDENGRIMGDAGFLEGPVVSSFGGKVWAAPWSPPASAKDNNNINNGGHLLTSAYESWATTLAAFPAYYKENTGEDLWGLSAQNEPDFVASYRSCIFSASQMNDFLKVLGPKLKALDPPVHLIAAEPDVWSHTWDNGDRFGVAIEGDATVSSLVDVIATHDYGSNVQSTTRPSPPANLSHHLWQTEATYTGGAGMGPALDFARSIYAAVTSGGANGWVYWWTPEFLNGGSTSSPPKRVYAMGNFSKFVRPDYVRVGITGVPSAVQIVPFFNPADGRWAIVALNSGNSAQQVSFFVAGTAWPGTVTPYVTSASSDLAPGSAISVTDGRFSGTLEGQSVTTFVGVQ